MTPSTDGTVASCAVHRGIGTNRRRDRVRMAVVIAGTGADDPAPQEADPWFGTSTGAPDRESSRRDPGLIAVPLDGAARTFFWHGYPLPARDAQVQKAHRPILPALAPRAALKNDLAIAEQPLRFADAPPGFPIRFSPFALDRLMLATQVDLPVVTPFHGPLWRRAPDRLPINARPRLDGSDGATLR